MLKARGEIMGYPTFFIGLSHENLKRLKEGKPIFVDGSPYDVRLRVYIFAGETEESMAAEMNVTNIEANPHVKVCPNPN